jgi:hypothetical protein
VRLTETHGKYLSLSCVSKRRTSKTNGRLLQEWRKKKNLCCASVFKTHGAVKLDARQRFFAMCFGQRTAKKLLAVRPIKDARQRFERTAKAVFPVVIAY